MIELPDFADPRLWALSICCHLTAKGRAVLAAIGKLPNRQKALIARFAKGSDRFILRVFGGDTDGHLHVDLLRIVKGGLQPTPMPRVNSTVPQIQELIKQFAGQPANSRHSAVFLVPIDDLPRDRGLVGPTLAPTRAGTTEIKQIQAELAISGGPIDGVDWALRGDGKEVMVELETTSTIRIDDNHLLLPYNSLNAAFRLLILGERS